MIGEFGELIDEAPYLLEQLIDGFAEEGAGIVRLEVRALHESSSSSSWLWLWLCFVSRLATLFIGLHCSY